MLIPSEHGGSIEVGAACSSFSFFSSHDMKHDELLYSARARWSERWSRRGKGEGRGADKGAPSFRQFDGTKPHFWRNFWLHFRCYD